LSRTGAQAGHTYPPTTGLAFGRHYMVALSALQAKSRDPESLLTRFSLTLNRRPPLLSNRLLHATFQCDVIWVVR